jgi:RNA polymerase sigma-70 factor (ECF subfamily)
MSESFWEGIGAGSRRNPDVGSALPSFVPWLLGILRAGRRPETTGEVDALVVARARRGEAAAFADIVRHYDDRLRAVAFRLLGDRDRMDDVLQEVYVKAFRSLPSFKGASALGTWLYRITYNACIDDLRRRPALVALSDFGDRSAEVADPGAGPEDIATGRGDLAAALNALPPDQRTAVMLVDAYGLDYADAAEVLGVRVGTIGSRLSRARAVLRDALGGDRE